jgi:FKBP-type peptidyl-prolyl cis-trans isomerase
MKFTSQLSAVLASLGLLVTASAQDPVKFNVPGVTTPAAQPAAPAKGPAASAAAPAAPVPAPATVKFTEAQMMEAYGFIFALRSGLPEELQALEFSPANRESVARGFGLALTGKDLPFDQAQAQQMQTQIQEFLKPKQAAFAAKRQAFLTELRLKNINEAAAFFTKLKENKNVVELPSGLRYEILKPGTGPMPKIGQLVTLHYTGSLVTGEVFGSTTAGENKEPIELSMTAATIDSPNGTIPGMVEGLLKVGVGGKAKLYIPPSLAYGDSGNQGIPPGAALVFEVEVLGVKDAPKTPAAK